MCNPGSSCATCFYGNNLNTPHCSGAGPLSVCSGKNSKCICPQEHGGIDPQLELASAPPKEFDPTDSETLFQSDPPQAGTGGSNDLGFDWDPNVEQPEAGQPDTLVSFDWGREVGKIFEPHDLDHKVALASDFNGANPLAPGEFQISELNAPTSESIEPLPDTEQAQGFFDSSAFNSNA